MIRKIAWGSAAVLSVAAIGLVIALQRANTEFRPLDDDARALAPGQFIELADGLTHYDVAGPETGPVVILVHGFSVPYYIWDTTFAALADAGFASCAMTCTGVATPIDPIPTTTVTFLSARLGT